MARRTAAAVVVVTASERRIIDTLVRILPAAAASYEQSVSDLGGPTRLSYRGTAHELRETLREALHQLAPDGEVMAEGSFKLEGDQKRPTQRQKALYILRKRRLSAEAMRAPELAVSLIDELGAEITRSAYTRGASSAHTATSLAKVRQLKMWVDAVLGELLEVHGQD